MVHADWYLRLCNFYAIRNPSKSVETHCVKCFVLPQLLTGEHPRKSSKPFSCGQRRRSPYLRTRFASLCPAAVESPGMNEVQRGQFECQTVEIVPAMKVFR